MYSATNDLFAREPQVEAVLQSALNALPAHIALLNEEATIVSVNTAWRAYGDTNGYDDNGRYGVGRNYLSICDSVNGRDHTEAHSVGEAIRDILNERRSLFQIEYPCHSPDQKQWFTLQVARFEWDQRLRVIVSHQDITALKATQVAFEQSQQRLQTVLDHVVDGIFTITEQGQIVSANPAAAMIFGYEQAQAMQGASLFDVIAPSHHLHYQTLLRLHHTASQRRPSEIAHEVNGRRLNGQTFPMYLAINRTRLENRWIFTAIVQDLTPRLRIEQDRLERERLQLQLEKERELRELKNRLMAMVSHELRTPLAVIQLSGDMLRRYSDRMSAFEREDVLVTIQSQVEQLEMLVDDVSALSRAERLEDSVHTEPINLLDFCANVIANMQMLHRETHQILFHSSGNADIHGDSKLLSQAITNLINNAVKYSEDGTRVNVTLHVQTDCAEIRVQDTGIGIPDADLPNLFEPFQRAENVGNRPGTGLGLAVAKRAVELHGGEISVKSKLHKGTTFTVRIPLSVTE